MRFIAGFVILSLLQSTLQEVNCTEGSTCNTCPSNCSNCTSSDNCTTCDDEFYQYNGTCFVCGSSLANRQCISCPDNFTLTNASRCCPQECSSCEENFPCTTCQDGFYNKECNTHCPSNCVDTFCDIKAGDCNSGCMNGWYGVKCLKNCNSNCQNQTCNQTDGSCYSCIEGYCGGTCSYMCVQNCSIYDDGGNCSNCNRGHFLDEGQCIPCPHRCSNCTSNETCGECDDGYYGNTCEQKCPTFCLNNTCEEGSGACKHGCVDGYFGSHCNGSCLQGCITCSNSSSCSQCLHKHREPDCEPECSSNCTNGTCHKDTLNCTAGCTDGTYGLTCDTNCGTQCTACERLTGSCTACKDGYHGRRCNNTCSDNCSITHGGTNVCDFNNGMCSLGCRGNKTYGNHCENECNKNCFEKQCNQNSGHCLKGCNKSYFGEICDSPCSTGCINGTCHSSTGTCTQGCIHEHTGDKCIKAKGNSSRLTTTTPSISIQPTSDTVVVVAGATTAAACIIAIIGAGFVIVRHRKNNRKVSQISDALPEVQFNEGQDTAEVRFKRPKSVHGGYPQLKNSFESRRPSLPLSLRTSNITVEMLPLHTSNINVEMNIPRYVTVRRSYFENGSDDQDDQADHTYYNSTCNNLTRPVKVSDLHNFVDRKPEMYAEEFKKLPYGLLKPYNDSQKPGNISLNRYKVVYPYDETRVVLVDGSRDYINASYLEGYNNPKGYIAAQGPTKETIGDNWRMIWQEKVGIIVMLTNVVELNVSKCEQYWPDIRRSQDYADITVTTDVEDVYAEFTVRRFSLHKADECRVLTQLHYTAWPDKGVPENVTTLVEFRQKVHSTDTNLKGPALVHCSAGIGRTGTYVALDILTLEGEAEGYVNIFGCVSKLRQQRPHMVQTNEQYIYLHKALVHSLTYNCRNIRADQFSDHYHALVEVSQSGDSHIEKIFKHLLAMFEMKMIANGGSSKRGNLEGGRTDRPTYRGVRQRPTKRLKFGNTNEDYINVVCINSYRYKAGLLICPIPPEQAAAEFWKLVLKERSPCIVMMEDPAEQNYMTSPYWSGERSVGMFGDLTITTKQGLIMDDFIKSDVSIELQEKSGVSVHDVTHFVYRGWKPGQRVPLSPASLINLIDEVENTRNQHQYANASVLIHCRTGAERSGLYCAVSILLEKVKVEQEVSVVNTVRTLKSRWRRIIPDLEQYTFCHEVIDVFLESFNTYSNFKLT